MSHSEVLTDEAWARIEPLLPSAAPRRGGRWRSHRQVIEAVAWKYRTGSPWRELPERFGPWPTAHARLARWTADGTCQRLLDAAQADADAAGELDWLVAVDSTLVRVHQLPRKREVPPGANTTRSVSPGGSSSAGEARRSRATTRSAAPAAD